MAYPFSYYQRSRSSPGEIYIYRKTEEEQIYIYPLFFFFFSYFLIFPFYFILFHFYFGVCRDPGPSYICLQSRWVAISPSLINVFRRGYVSVPVCSLTVPPPSIPSLFFLSLSLSHLLPFLSSYIYIRVPPVRCSEWRGRDGTSTYTHPTRPINCFLDILPVIGNSQVSPPPYYPCYFIIFFSFLFFFYYY